jgi:hypothetical protein
MENVMLTQQEAEKLIAMKKVFSDDGAIILNDSFNQTIPLISENRQEHFLLDLKQGRIDLKKLKYQNRYDEIIQLVRFESKGVHENPDGEIIKGAHIHIYKEGYGDKFAFPAKDFENSNEVLETLTKFCEFCNIDSKRFVFQSLSYRGGGNSK